MKAFLVDALYCDGSHSHKSIDGHKPEQCHHYHSEELYIPDLYMCMFRRKHEKVNTIWNFPDKETFEKYFNEVKSFKNTKVKEIELDSNFSDFIDSYYYTQRIIMSMAKSYVKVGDYVDW